MKKINLLAWTVLTVVALSLSACSDDKTKDDPTPPQPEKSKACKMTSFKLALTDGSKLDGVIYDFEQTIEVTYKSTMVELLKSATAEVVISEKATITPDPSVAADYSKSDVKFIVTAENGKDKNAYTVVMKEHTVKFEHKFDLVWEKKVGEIGMMADKHPDVGVAVSGDKIVMANLDVFDNQASKVGTLNTTGMASTALISMTNDSKGVLLASVDAGETAPDGKRYQIWIWKNGYNAAPEQFLISTNNITQFISASGDMAGDGLLNAKGASHEVGPHFCWHTTGGDWANKNFVEVKTQLPSDDGSWTQMVSAASASVNDYFFVYDSQSGPMSRGYVMDNATAASAARKGPGAWYPNINGEDGWGNYSGGSVRAFTFDGKPYGIICTTTWAHSYFSVCNPVSTDELTLFVEPAGGDQICPSAAYYYNDAEQCGYIYLFTPTYSIYCYKVTRSEII